MAIQFSDLPIEILIYILKKLDNNAVRNLLCTSKYNSKLPISKWDIALRTEGLYCKSFDVIMHSGLRVFNNIKCYEYLLSFAPSQVVRAYIWNEHPYNIIYLLMWDLYISRDPMANAIQHGHTDIIKYFLVHDLHFHSDIYFGIYLYKAIKLNHIDIVELLLIYGGNPDRALETAALSGNLDIIKLLLKYGLSSDSQTTWKCIMNNKRVDIAKLLIEHGANTNNEWLMKMAIKYQSIDIVDLLIANAYNVNKCCGSAVRCAASQRSIKIFKTLIDAGANVRFHNDLALRNAVHHKCVENVQLLLDCGADARVHNSGLLYVALKNDDITTAKLLMMHGADIHVVKELAFRTAVKKNYNNAVAFLLKYKISNDVIIAGFHRAASVGYIKIVKLLYHSHVRASPNAEYKAIIKAANGGYITVFKFLIMNMDKQTTDAILLTFKYKTEYDLNKLLYTIFTTDQNILRFLKKNKSILCCCGKIRNGHIVVYNNNILL